MADPQTISIRFAVITSEERLLSWDIRSVEHGFENLSRPESCGDPGFACIQMQATKLNRPANPLCSGNAGC